MNKTLRIFTALAILGSSFLFAQSASATTKADAPTDVIASATGTTSIDVSFNAPVNDGGEPITEYLAVANPAQISSIIFQSGGGTISLTGLTPGTAYTISVYAININGESIGATASAITHGVCSEGGTFNITNGAVTSSTPNCAGIVRINNGVTSINSRAFQSRSGITQVFIYDTVTFIGSLAFYNNTNLTSVYIGSAVTLIGSQAFDNARRLTSLTIGNAVTSIGSMAFANSALTSVTIPNSVILIGPSAFFYTPSLSSLTIGNSVTTIRDSAFEYAGLTSLTIPNSVTSLGSRSFSALPSALTTYTYCGNSLDSLTLASSGVTSRGRLQVCPSNLAVPGAPTIGIATATGTTTATVDFTSPTSDGGSTILSYTATSTPGSITGTVIQAGSGTISISGLTPATSYTFVIQARNVVGASVTSSSSNAITTETSITAPGVPTSILATATGKRTATVSFAAPASDGGSVITSYTVVSTPGSITKNLTQAVDGIVTFDNLQPGTSYTFSVTAINSIGTSAAGVSNAITTTAADVSSLTAITFADDGTGTAGKLAWSGKNIDAVLYNGPANSYPGPFTFGAFSTGWNGTIRNLTPDTQYTVSIFAISVDGIGESKSLTFKTGPGLLAGSGVAMAQSSSKLTQIISWVNQNSFVPGEAANINSLLTKFDALVTSAHRSYIKVPTSRVSKVEVKSLTPRACSVVSATAKVDAGLVSALTHDTCTISYTVSGASRAWATLVKDFTFKKITK